MKIEGDIMKPFIQEKDNYIANLYQAISQTELHIQHSPDLPIYKGILTQLLYIKNIIVNENRKPTPKDAGPLTLGAIAVKNFDDDGNNPFANMLMDIYGGFKIFSRENDHSI